MTIERQLMRISVLSRSSHPLLTGTDKITSGSEKGVFWKRGLFRKVHLLEILENLEILEILENRQTVENKGESDHFLEILENLEILEVLEISSSEKTPFVMTPFSGPDNPNPRGCLLKKGHLRHSTI